MRFFAAADILALVSADGEARRFAASDNFTRVSGECGSLGGLFADPARNAARCATESDRPVSDAEILAATSGLDDGESARGLILNPYALSLARCKSI